MSALGQEKGSHCASKGITHACRGAMYSHGKTLGPTGSPRRGEEGSAEVHPRLSPQPTSFQREQEPVLAVTPASGSSTRGSSLAPIKSHRLDFKFRRLPVTQVRLELFKTIKLLCRVSNRQ
jgi:hypothetical protein